MLETVFITIHPQLIKAYESFGVFHSCAQKGLARFHVLNLRDFTPFKHGSVDDKPYGGGDGMVMRPEPLAHAIHSLSPRPYVIIPSPGGKLFQQADAERLLKLGRPLAFVCGRFGGIDQRFIEQYGDEELSLGNFVLSGGELAALSMADAILRLIPGALGNEESSHFDSFAAGTEGLLEHPLYTRPPVFEGLAVPDVLLSGDHARIAAWRRAKSWERTQVQRPDLL